MFMVAAHKMHSGVRKDYVSMNDFSQVLNEPDTRPSFLAFPSFVSTNVRSVRTGNLAEKDETVNCA